MSKLTNPETEQSVTCGFYNSLSGDRKYDSANLSDLVGSLITDGVFSSVGEKFVVHAGEGNTVIVGTGKAWFNDTWTKNDALLPVDCGASEVLLDRIDAIVIRVDGTQSVRDNFIQVVHGTPASSPVRPTMINTNYEHWYPLCYIYRKAESTEIIESNITNMVGTDSTPFVTGILQTVSLDELLGQWQDQLNRFIASEEAEVDAFIKKEKSDFDTFTTERENELIALITDVTNELNAWTDGQKTTFLNWFNEMKDQLTTDAAGNLQMQISRNEIIQYLMHGLPDGEKTISDDGTSIQSQSKDGSLALGKNFRNEFSTCTTILLRATDGTRLGQMTKNFSADGSVIDTEIWTYLDV